MRSAKKGHVLQIPFLLVFGHSDEIFSWCLKMWCLCTFPQNKQLFPHKTNNFSLTKQTTFPSQNKQIFPHKTNNLSLTKKHLFPHKTNNFSLTKQTTFLSQNKQLFPHKSNNLYTSTQIFAAATSRNIIKYEWKAAQSK